MIIDAHAHIHQYSKKHYSERFAEIFMQYFSRYPLWWDTKRNWRKEDVERTAPQMVADMDRAGIDKTFACAVCMKPFDVDVPADYIAEAVQSYPDRLLGFVSPDPIGGLKAVREIDRAIDKLGLSGVGEFLPAYNLVKMNDQRIFPIYERVEELGVPIIVHTGWTMAADVSMDLQNPILLDEIGCKFPELKVVIAHAGFQWAKEAIMVTAKYPNFYMDFAFWHDFPQGFYIDTLQFIKSMDLIDRILWGSDYPWCDTKPIVEKVKQIPSECKKVGLEPYITDEDINKYLGENAAKLLGIK